MNRKELRQLIANHFDLEDIRTLSFDLGIDFDSLGGERKDAKIRELISLCERNNHIPELFAVLAEHRPNVSWEAFDLTQDNHQVRGKMRKFADNRSIWTKPQVWWVPIVVALIGLIGIGISSWSEKSKSFSYSVHVQEATTGKEILGAEVVIEIMNHAPLDEVTDVHGIAIFSLDETLSDQSAKLHVRATGYKPHTQNINLRPNQLPDVVPLEPEPDVVLLEPEPDIVPPEPEVDVVPFEPDVDISTPWTLAIDNWFTDGVCMINVSFAQDAGRVNAVEISVDIPQDGSFCGWFILLNSYDASEKTHLTFWVKGANGGEKFEIGIKDMISAPGTEVKILREATNDWEQISIPLSEFSGQDLFALENISLGFNYVYGSGTIYVADFMFEGP